MFSFFKKERMILKNHFTILEYRCLQSTLDNLKKELGHAIHIFIA